ncbi:uncharacterized protein TRIVIDRAFT_223898 [Trichoderma virens Gv29-8]|uniref:Major facilitator superfamily (MFS) profile domain-containing protein n=1 Tax=Hypocrea virens (strain Gv29-8 / FGSC 10586) TaxID=413071 RepID=G9MYF9_HYPVG|nr:uncharacterized protein TRIVIDRAFT_223898 [Trichoderma virens Gv29-8]EHK20581.1 hypothetical protein TRIVIDRAFT_223898 [Trichoderma virens Gv29-8]
MTIQADAEKSRHEVSSESVIQPYHRAQFFITILADSAFPAVVVPTLTLYFGTLEDVGWYLSTYRLASGSFQLLFGKLYALLGPKPLVLTSLAVFSAGSLLSALATKSYIFILARGVTGLATAGVTSGAFAIIIQAAPLGSRPKYASIGGAAEAVASLIAPVIGGLLIDRLGWQWCFFIELPLIGAVFAMIAFCFKPTEKKSDTGNIDWRRLLRHLDLAGTALFVAGFTTLVLAVQMGGNKYPWSDWRVLVPLGVSIALLFAFAALQYHLGDRGTLPPRIIRRRSMLFGFLFACCNNGALSVIEYYIPIYLQIVRGLEATTSGFMTLPIGAGLILSLPLAGFLTSFFGYCNQFMILNGLLTPIATGLLATLAINTEMWRLVVYQALLGFGTGVGFQGPQVAAQAILSDNDSQIGIAIIQFAQALGPAIFVAAAQTIFASRLASLLPGQGAAPPADHALVLPENRDGDYKMDLVGYNEALIKTFYLPVALAGATLIGALGVEWRSLKVKRGSAL